MLASAATTATAAVAECDELNEQTSIQQQSLTIKPTPSRAVDESAEDRKLAP